jgi:hypothetical protein
MTLDVKSAFEDVDAQIFLTFLCAAAEDQIKSNHPIATLKRIDFGNHSLFMGTKGNA